MKKELVQKIAIPEDVDVEIENSTLSVKGPNGENKRKFSLGSIILEKKDNQIIISHKKATKKEKRMINTISSHISNMIRGVKEKFEYTLKVCFSHFPISVEVQNNKAIIKNFLGEKIPRKAEIPEGVDVKVNKDIITITSIDKELVGMTAANFERATKIRMRDRRVFQDGIYITNKAKKEI